MRVEREAVLGAGVVLTASTPIVDVRGSRAGSTARDAFRRAPSSFPGTLPKQFPAGEFGTPCALIVGTRNESTDRKTSLNAALREYRGSARMNPRVARRYPAVRYSADRREEAPTSIDLGLGEPTLLPRMRALRTSRCERVAEHGVKYTPNAGDPALREAIARHYAIRRWIAARTSA